MSDIAEEIASQPSVWHRASDMAAGSGLALPQPGERVLAVGCGTSWFVSQAYAALREDAGAGETDAATATELPPERTLRPRRRRSAAAGRPPRSSTRSPRLRDRDVPTTAITAVLGSPVAQLARRSLVLDFADERSVVQTRFATGALALLRAHLGEDLDRAISDAGAALADPLPVEPSRFDHFVFLGHRWTVGLAHEAALKMREAAQAYTESYPAMEYRHGPVSVAGPGSLVWILGTPDPTIADDVRATGATVVEATLDPMAELATYPTDGRRAQRSARP